MTFQDYQLPYLKGYYKNSLCPAEVSGPRPQKHARTTGLNIQVNETLGPVTRQLSREKWVVRNIEADVNSNQILYYPDTGEAILDDKSYSYKVDAVVVDIETGEEKARSNTGTRISANMLWSGVSSRCLYGRRSCWHFGSNLC